MHTNWLLIFTQKILRFILNSLPKYKFTNLYLSRLSEHCELKQTKVNKLLHNLRQFQRLSKMNPSRICSPSNTLQSFNHGLSIFRKWNSILNSEIESLALLFQCMFYGFNNKLPSKNLWQLSCWKFDVLLWVCSERKLQQLRCHRFLLNFTHWSYSKSLMLLAMLIKRKTHCISVDTSW